MFAITSTFVSEGRCQRRIIKSVYCLRKDFLFPVTTQPPWPWALATRVCIGFARRFLIRKIDSQKVPDLLMLMARSLGCFLTDAVHFFTGSGQRYLSTSFLKPYPEGLFHVRGHLGKEFIRSDADGTGCPSSSKSFESASQVPRDVRFCFSRSRRDMSSMDACSIRSDCSK